MHEHPIFVFFQFGRTVLHTKQQTLSSAFGVCSMAVSTFCRQKFTGIGTVRILFRLILSESWKIYIYLFIIRAASISSVTVRLLTSAFNTKPIQYEYFPGCNNSRIFVHTSEILSIYENPTFLQVTTRESVRQSQIKQIFVQCYKIQQIVIHEN